jgi:hypothetical protein
MSDLQRSPYLKDKDLSRFRNAVLVPSLAIVALLAPMGLIGTAHASATANGCTVTPHIPQFDHDDELNGNPVVSYRITVTCEAGLKVETLQKRWEQDQLDVEGDSADDFAGESLHLFDFTAGAGTQTIDVERELPITGPASEGIGEEMYQALAFRVISEHGTFPWTSYELTTPQRIYH